MAFGTRINDTLYAGGQPSKEQLLHLSKDGIARIIDLRPADEDRGFDEPATATSAGLEYHTLPIATEADLTPANVRLLDRWLSNSAQTKTLIHCASSNRVGALLALRAGWLQGATPAAALDAGRAAGLKSLEPAVRKLLSQSAS